jgi:hypothetical protein
MSRIATSWRWCERRPASGVEIEMNRTLNAKVTGPFAPPRAPTVEEELAARERMLKQLYPRPGPPPKPYIHVPPRSNRDPGAKPLPTIAEAMAAPSGRRGPG